MSCPKRYQSYFHFLVASYKVKQRYFSSERDLSLFCVNAYSYWKCSEYKVGKKNKGIAQKTQIYMIRPN